MSLETKEMRNHAQNIAKGILAILVWVGCYLFVEWYKSVGFIGYIKFALPIAAFLCILAGISEKFRTFFSKYVFGFVNYAFDVYEEKMGWLVFFLFAIMYGAIIYFLLAAPYGVLCHLGWKTCGKW
jgi:hypothetical protein